MVVAVALLYAVAVGVLFVSMGRSNTVAGKALAAVPGPAFMVLPLEALWTRARRGALEVGQPAPDFDLPTLDGSTRVRLSSLRGGKPVVLIFGSYTCPPFRREILAVQQLFETYRDRATFLFVYVEEAHASDVWPLASNVKAGVVYETPRTAAERTGIATTCMRALEVRMPILVDDMENRTVDAYAAWPTRMYVIEQSGAVAFKSRPGPFGFAAAELERALAAAVPARAR
ncbi:MAG: deiodinase-like protein [Vicinamibacteria bacterium]